MKNYIFKQYIYHYKTNIISQKPIDICTNVFCIQGGPVWEANADP
jgi:hypothetical protein